MKYRADIDGLRALAVVPVVLFHLDVAGFGGGFVGVDIFFVISGYLITGLITEEIKQGHFTIAGFYERRIRRIFPALFFMLWCALVAGMVLLLPQDMKALNASLAATSLFISNIYLWLGSGYFEKAAEMQPLLHTWSLAVEEQFYIFFPIFWMLIWRWGRRWRSWTWLVLAGSFVLSVYAVRHHRDAAFYLLPTRAWELLIGSVIALNAVPRLSWRWLNEAFAAAGLVLILLAVFGYDRATRFPGEAALLPCIGAGLIIYAGLNGRFTLIARMLSWRPVVFVGLISYSLYLWHWPLIVFAKYRNVAALSNTQSAMVLAASLALATFSWRFVERPFRRSATTSAAGRDGMHADKPRPWIANAAIAYGVSVIAASVVVCAMSYGVYSSDRALLAIYGERVYRYDREALQIHSTSDCTASVTAALSKTCLLGDTQVKPTLALWGDSYADTLKDSLAVALRKAKLSAGRFVMHSCPSILHTRLNRIDDPSLTQKCMQFNQATFELLTHDASINTVVLLDNYLWYLETTKATTPLLSPTHQYANEAERRQLIVAELVATIDALSASGKRVIVVGAYPPGVGASVIARSLNFDNELPPAARMARADYDRKVLFVNSALAGIKSDKVSFVDPSVLFCRNLKESDCSVVQHDAPMLSDGGHLSASGAADLTELILNTMSNPYPASLRDKSVLASAAG